MSDDRIRLFENDDVAYQEWVDSNWGYMLIQRGPGEYMLHMSECSHLGGFGEVQLTAKPRRWAPLKYDLIDWCRGATGAEPLECTTCQ